MSSFESRAVAKSLLHDEQFRDRARSALQQASSGKLDALRRVRLLNQCLAQGGWMEEEPGTALAAPPPQAEPSHSDSDLSSVADSELSEEGEGGEDCMAVLQAALRQRQQQQQQQQQPEEAERSRAAVVIQKHVRAHLARLEARVLRELARMAAANKHRRIIAAASAEQRRAGHPSPAQRWVRALLQRGQRLAVKRAQCRRAAAAAAQQVGGVNVAELPCCPLPVQQLVPLQPAPLHPDAEGLATSAMRALQPEGPGAAAASPAQQALCEVGCQTEPEQGSGESQSSPAGPATACSVRLSTPAVPQAKAITQPASIKLWSSSNGGGSSTRSATAGILRTASRLGSPTPQQSHVQQPRQPSAVSDAGCSPPATQSSADPTSGGGRSGTPAASSSNSRSLGRSASVLQAAGTVQVALESPGSVASLAAQQVCKSLREWASTVEPGSTMRPKPAKIKSSHPVSAARG